MKLFIFFCAVLVSANGISIFGDLAPGLRVNFPSFFKLSRFEAEAISEGWVRVPRGDDVFLPTLRMYCQATDYAVCTLFDELGYICGIQISVPIANFTNNPLDPLTMGFRKWSAPATAGGEPADYYTNNQFFISEETLNSDPSIRHALRANNETLYEGGVWVPHIDGSLVKIDTSLSKLDPIWTRQACVPAMGRHYMYNSTTDGNCDVLYPWFLIYQDDTLVAIGYTTFGSLTPEAEGKRAWFERPIDLVVKTITPRAPQCVYDLAAQHRTISLHVYYVASPLEITCVLN